MAIEEKEQQETLLKDLIEKIEKDPLPTNIYDVENTDPLVLLGKLNEIISKLKAINALIASSDNKADEAVKQAILALTKASEAFSKALQSEVIAQDAKTTAEELGSDAKATAENALNVANEANSKAEEANEQAQTAHDTAGDALAEADTALQTARQALEQVTEGLGTKVYNTDGNLMNTAKFTGQNGVNVDMDENEPETFNVRLDNTITQAIEDNHTQGQTNKSNIEALTNRVTANEGDIVNLAEMLSATEELAQSATEDITNTIKPDIAEIKSKNAQQDTNIENKVDKSALGDFTFSSRTGEGVIKHQGYELDFGRGYFRYSGESYIFLDINGNANPFRAQINLKDIALIEEKGDGFIRFTNGFQICWGRTGAVRNTTITYPRAFKDANSYSCSGCSNGWSGSYGNYGMSDLTATSFYYNADKNYIWLWVAIGYWK